MGRNESEEKKTRALGAKQLIHVGMLKRVLQDYNLVPLREMKPNRCLTGWEERFGNV